MLQGSASHMCEAAKDEDGSAFKSFEIGLGSGGGGIGRVVEDQGQTSYGIRPQCGQIHLQEKTDI